MYDDSPDWRLITGLCECLYHSHPIRSDIAGTVESIAEITPEMLYDCCKGVLCAGQYGAGRSGQHQHGADPGCLRPPRPDGRAPGGKGRAPAPPGADDAGGGRKDHRHAHRQVLLRSGLQRRAAAFRRPAQRDAVRAHPLLHLRRDVAALPPPLRRGPDQPGLRR